MEVTPKEEEEEELWWWRWTAGEEWLQQEEWYKVAIAYSLQWILGA